MHILWGKKTQQYLALLLMLCDESNLAKFTVPKEMQLKIK